MLLHVIFLVFTLFLAVAAVPTKYTFGNSVTEAPNVKHSLSKRIVKKPQHLWFDDNFSLGTAMKEIEDQGSYLFLNVIAGATGYTSNGTYPLNIHDGVGFVPLEGFFHGSLTSEQAAHYMSSRDRLPKTPPSIGCYDVYSYAEKPLCLHVKNGFTYVNCARIVSRFWHKNNIVFLIDRMLDPTFNDYKQAKDGTCQR
ncbi:hypothetical protein BDF19DRAFT_451569 [Syncephalis fuscata]|nr:hypothetical protein BDF19DRAFT_451569 [Syncephalis fuscata]